MCRYVYLLMGVLIGSAVIPIAYCLVWSKCTANAAIIGAVSGLCLAVMSWLVTAKCLYGELTLTTTGTHPLAITKASVCFVHCVISHCSCSSCITCFTHACLCTPCATINASAFPRGFRRTSVYLWLIG